MRLSPVCSHCGYEFDDEELWHGEYTVGEVHVGDGDVSELKCPNDDCGKTFYVSCSHSFNFTQVDEDGDDL